MSKLENPSANFRSCWRVAFFILATCGIGYADTSLAQLDPLSEYGFYQSLPPDEQKAFLCEWAEDLTEEEDSRFLYTLWNGFLNNMNILELMNPESGELQANVRILGPKGEELRTIGVTLRPSEQRDLIINDLAAIRDSYGIIEVEPNTVTGRLFYYRQSADLVNYDYAFALPLQKPTRENSAVSFNTFHPSLDPAEADHLVANWLSIVNLEEDTSATFSVRKYDQTGNLLSSSRYSVPPRGRIDVDGGHVNPGPGHVGVNLIIPEDSSLRYLAQVVRYGYRSHVPDPSPGFDFAFPLIAKKGDSGPHYAPIAVSYVDSSNWVEVVNTSAAPNSVRVEMTDLLGRKVHNEVLTLEAHGQRHVFTNAYLQAASGRVKLQSLSGNGFIAQSMFYYRERDHGHVLAINGSQSKIEGFEEISGNYNLFLEQDSHLRLVNTSDRDALISVNGYYPTGASKTISAWVPASGTMEIGAHDQDPYFFSPNTYGVITVRGNQPLVGEVMRRRLDQYGHIDIYAPTEMNPPAEPVSSECEVVCEPLPNSPLTRCACAGNPQDPGSGNGMWQPIPSQHYVFDRIAPDTMFVPTCLGDVQPVLLPFQGGLNNQTTLCATEAAASFNAGQVYSVRLPIKEIDESINGASLNLGQFIIRATPETEGNIGFRELGILAEWNVSRVPGEFKGPRACRGGLSTRCSSAQPSSDTITFAVAGTEGDYCELEPLTVYYLNLRLTHFGRYCQDPVNCSISIDNSQLEALMYDVLAQTEDEWQNYFVVDSEPTP